MTYMSACTHHFCDHIKSLWHHSLIYLTIKFASTTPYCLFSFHRNIQNNFPIIIPTNLPVFLLLSSKIDNTCKRFTHSFRVHETIIEIVNAALIFELKGLSSWQVFFVKHIDRFKNSNNYGQSEEPCVYTQLTIQKKMMQKLQV